MEIVGYDVKGEIVNNGDILVWDKVDVAYIYRVENGEPKIIGDWQVASVGLVNYPKEKDWSGYEGAPKGEVERMKTYYQRVLNRQIDELVKAPRRFTKIVNKLTKESPYMCVEGTLDNPIPYDKHGERLVL